MREVPAPFDVVLTSNAGYPLDQNLYQAVKGMSAAAQIVKPRGTIVCAAECRDGLPTHGSYGAVLASAPTPAALLAMINAEGYAMPDQWQVQIQAQILRHADVLVKASGLLFDELRAAHLMPIDDVSGTVRDALRRYRPRGYAMRITAGASDHTVRSVFLIRARALNDRVSIRRRAEASAFA